MASVSERQEWKWGRTKQITIMEPLARRPSVYDRQKTRVQFHQCALLSSQLSRNHNYTLLRGLVPLRFVWIPLLCLPFFWPCHTRTTDRKWKGIMDAYLMALPATDFTVFTLRHDMSSSPLFPSLCWKIYARKQNLAFREWYPDRHSTVKAHSCLWAVGHNRSLKANQFIRAEIKGSWGNGVVKSVL